MVLTNRTWPIKLPLQLGWHYWQQTEAQVHNIMKVSHTIMCIEEFKAVFSCHFCIPNVVSQTYAVIN